MFEELQKKPLDVSAAAKVLTSSMLNSDEKVDPDYKVHLIIASELCKPKDIDGPDIEIKVAANVIVDGRSEAISIINKFFDAFEKVMK